MQRISLNPLGFVVIAAAVVLFVLLNRSEKSGPPHVNRSATNESVASPSPVRVDPPTATPERRVAPAVLVATTSARDPFEGLREASKPTLNIFARIDNGPWKRTDAVYPIKGQRVGLRIDPVADAHVRWFAIRPDLSKMYKNASFPWDPDPYKWQGFGKIDYARQELTHLRDRWTIRPFPSEKSSSASATARGEPSRREPSRRDPYAREDLGSFWFQVEVAADGRLLRSPGIADSDHRGLSPEVLRVSVMEDDSYIGHLTSFHNVPGVFGSVTYQSRHYIGVDCADVLIAAYGRWKNKPIEKNYNVAMLVSQWPRVREFEIADGAPQTRIRWNTDVRRGDFIAVRYRNARQYQHVGALYRDANANGLLDGDDLVLHAGPRPLQSSRLKDGSFNGHVAIIRPK